jgi:hypothetical protein
MGYKLKEVGHDIFLLDFDNQYDLAMTFLRYQEFYECASTKFRGKSFKLLDFMSWYAKKYGDGGFNYTTSWAGFNFPASIIPAVRELGIPDPNDYDAIMFEIYNRICQETKRPSYLIGTCGDNALEHEIAHGLFFVDPSYKRTMTHLVKTLDADVKKRVFKHLTTLGYARKVLIDETQAYMATGAEYSWRVSGKTRMPFIEQFKKYYPQKV